VLFQVHAEDVNIAGCRRNQPYDHTDRGAFPGPVRPQKTKNFSFSDLKIEIIDGGSLAELLRQSRSAQNYFLLILIVNNNFSFYICCRIVSTFG
jgi:hypothetical protein